MSGNFYFETYEIVPGLSLYHYLAKLEKFVLRLV